MTKIKSFASAIETAEALAQHIAQQISLADENFFLAVSGGSTPKMLFEAMVKIKSQITWKKLHLFWVDERCVPPTDDESNYKMTYDTLLKHVSLPEQNIHRMKGELPPGDGLSNYKNEIKQLPKVEGFPQFDSIILGMGADGHTASIFPTEMHLLNSGDALAIGTNPYSGQKRLTLTGKTINNAKEIIFHVTGASKKEVLGKILNKKENYLDFPASHIANNNVTWYLDKEAAEK